MASKINMEMQDADLYNIINRASDRSRAAEAVIAIRILNDLIASRSTVRLNAALAACYTDPAASVNFVKRIHAVLHGVNDKMQIQGSCLIRTKKGSYEVNPDIAPDTWQQLAAKWQKIKQGSIYILDPATGSKLRFLVARKPQETTTENLLTCLDKCADLSKESKSKIAALIRELAGK